MAEITAQMVKDLREKSGAGMMDCKKALTESDGDMKKAMNLLRERGEAIANKRASRAAKEGVVSAFVAADRKAGAVVELNSESDFVARNDDFRAAADVFVKHVAGLPNLDDVPGSKMESGETVADTVQGLIAKIGEKIILSRWDRIVAGQDGYVFHYIHPPGKIGVLVEVSGPAAAATAAEFEEFARDIAMHIAATSPVCVRRDEVPSGNLDNEREIYRKQALNEGKPEKIVEKIVEGRVQKYYGEVVLLEQPFCKNPDQKVTDYVKQAGAKFGGEVGVTRFVRFRLGELADEAGA